MRYLFIILIWSSCFVSYGQHSLIVRSTENKIESNNLKVQKVFDDYYLLESSSPIDPDQKWKFSVVPKMANGHMSFHTNEILIRCREGLSDVELLRLAEFGEAEINAHNDRLCMLRTAAKNISEVEVKLALIQELEFVQNAQLNQYFTLQDCTTDPLYPYQWHLENTGSSIQYSGVSGADIDANNAWNSALGDSIVVSIMDSGVDTLHEEFTGRLLPGLDAFATDSINTHGYPFLDFDENAHGTACAGIIGAEQNNDLGVSGVAPNSVLVPVRIFFYIDLNNQITPFTNMNALLTGCAYSWNTMEADVISCSAGLSPEYITLLTIDTAICNEELRQAQFEGRNGKGSVLLFSAGNDNVDEVLWPANLAETIAVGASDMCDTRKRPSDCSGESWWGSSYGHSLDLVAPGVKIATCDISGAVGYSSDDYAMTFNGTSAACPVAAGVAALLLSENPDLTSEEVRHVLNYTCEKVPNYAYDSSGIDGSWNEEVGHGRINAHLALGEAFNASVISPNSDSAINLFPNPASDWIHIEHILTPSPFVIYDSFGRIHSTGQIDKEMEPIPIQGLSPGLYFISLNSQTLRFQVLP